MPTAVPLKCTVPGCAFETSTPQGMGAHRSKHARESKQQENLTLEGAAVYGDKQESATAIEQVTKRPSGTKRQTQTLHSGISEVAYAVAFGRIQELLTRMAVEYDLPPSSFAREVIGALHRQTIR